MRFLSKEPRDAGDMITATVPTNIDNAGHGCWAAAREADTLHIPSASRIVNTLLPQSLRPAVPPARLPPIFGLRLPSLADATSCHLPSGSTKPLQGFHSSCGPEEHLKINPHKLVRFLQRVGDKICMVNALDGKHGKSSEVGYRKRRSCRTRDQMRPGLAHGFWLCQEVAQQAPRGCCAWLVLTFASFYAAPQSGISRYLRKWEFPPALAMGEPLSPLWTLPAASSGSLAQHSTQAGCSL